MAKRPDIPGIKYFPYLLAFGLGILATYSTLIILKVYKFRRINAFINL